MPAESENNIKIKLSRPVGPQGGEGGNDKPELKNRLEDAKRSSMLVNSVFIVLFLAWLWGMSWILDQNKSLHEELDTLVIVSNYADGISITFSGASVLVNGDLAKGRSLISRGDEMISTNRGILSQHSGVPDSVMKVLVGIELESYGFHTEIEEIASMLSNEIELLDEQTRVELITASRGQLTAMIELGLKLEAIKKTLYEEITARIIKNSNQIMIIGVLMLLGIVLMALGLAYNWFFMRRLVESLRHLSSATSRIAKGDLSSRIEMKQADEFGGIVEAFNKMMSGLKFNIECRELAEEQYKKHAETLQAIMDNTPFGIWLTDQEGRIIFVNDRLCKEMGLVSPDAHNTEFIGELFDQQVRDEFTVERGRGMGEDNTRVVFPTLDIEGKGRRDFKVSRVTVRNYSGDISGFVGIVEDITDANKMQVKISYQSTHDSLTGLLNRDAFKEKLDRVCKNTMPSESLHALCYFDLDQFKIVNDTCGHHAGDELLRQLTALYKKQLRNTEPVLEADILEPALARLGGDEFCLLLYNCTLEGALKVAQKLIDISLSYRFTYGDKFFSIGCSVGVVPVYGGDDSVELMRRADCACYVAKERGRSRVHFSEEDDQLTRDRLEVAGWATRLTEAINSNNLVLYEQTIAPISKSGKGDRFEVLVRYRAEDGSIVSPAVFLPAAERFSLMPQLDKWVIDHAFTELERLYGDGKGHQLDSASINLSGQTLGEYWLYDFLLKKFKYGSIRPNQICFEITESAAIVNYDVAIELIGRLRKVGCTFSLDDFGAGLSSFSYLKSFNVDYLKIDGSLVRNIDTDRATHEMVVAIYKVAEVMGMQTVAEFVENDAILQNLRRIGVDFAQGYGIARPVPLGSKLLGSSSFDNRLGSLS